MMPARLAIRNKLSFQIPILPFDEVKTSELASFALKNADVDFSEQQLLELCGLLDGTPINVKLAMEVISQYGLEVFLADPGVLIEWKRRRAEDFLKRIKFSELEADILAIFYDYRYIHFETLSSMISVDAKAFAAALRKLEEFCCLERRGNLYAISPPIHDAIGRDKRFQRTEDWRRSKADKIVNMVSDYKEDEVTPVALMEAAATAAIITEKSTTLISRLMLPSYYLALASRAYHDERWDQARELCKQAWDRRAQLTTEGKIETLRLWGLTGIRLENHEILEFVLKELDTFSANKVAQRHSFFLRGFNLRRKKKYDEAELEFLSAYKLAPKNAAINRELANLYRHQREFVEGEGYVRAAYDSVPTNPYILDVLLECLLGKASLGVPVNQGELDRLLGELERYGDVPGSSFFQTRVAHDLFRRKAMKNALEAAEKAIDRTPDFLSCRFLRADIFLALRDSVGARKDLEAINKILDRRGGFSIVEEVRAIDLEIRLLAEEHNYRAAREKLDRSNFLPKKVYHRLRNLLARSINAEPKQADFESKHWAKGVLSSHNRSK